LGWPSGTFFDAYVGNREAANDLALEASPVATVICELADEGVWKGTASELLEKINGRASEEIRRQRAWPRNAQSLSNMLRRLAPNLRAVGVAVEFWRERDRRRHRMMAIKRVSKATVRSVRSFDSPSNVPSENGASRPQKGDGRPNTESGSDGLDGVDGCESSLSDPQALRKHAVDLWRRLGEPIFDDPHNPEMACLDLEDYLEPARGHRLYNYRPTDEDVRSIIAELHASNGADDKTRGDSRRLETHPVGAGSGDAIEFDVDKEL